MKIKILSILGLIMFGGYSQYVIHLAQTWDTYRTKSCGVVANVIDERGDIRQVFSCPDGFYIK